MPFGFYIIMAAQFFSALADNTLLIVAIAALREINAPAAYEPLLKTFFTVSYVVLAAFVGAFADSMPKWRVMFISNTIKIIGCGMMFFSVHPLVAYAVVGLGAAAYSPAKYGILTEYLPHRLLVVANGWIEGLTVGGDHPRGGHRRFSDPAGNRPRPAGHGLSVDRYRNRHDQRNGHLLCRPFLHSGLDLQPLHP